MLKKSLFFLFSCSLFLLFEGLFSVLLKEKMDNVRKTFMCVKHKQKNKIGQIKHRILFFGNGKKRLQSFSLSNL